MKSSINLKLLMTFSLIASGSFTFAEDANNSERKTPVVSSSSANPSLNQSANTSKSANGSAGTVSKVIGAANMALGAMNLAKCSSQCYSCCAQGVLHLAMGAMSFKQASNHGGAGYTANISGLDTSAWDNPYGDPNLPGTHNSNTQGNTHSPYVPSGDLKKDKDLANNVNLGKFEDIKNKLTTTGIGGVKLNPKTGIITDKNTGKTYDVNKLGTPEGMAEAGFSKDDIAAALGASSAAEKAALKKMGLESPTGIGAATAESGFMDGGSGSGGVLSGKAGDIGTDGGSGHGRNIASFGGVNKIPSGQVAGLTKNFNGERIGVPAENIFNMMTRRYKTKEKQNSFFDPSESVKMPQ